MHGQVVPRGWGHTRAGVRTAVAVALALIVPAILGAGRASAEPGAPLTPLGPIAEGDDVRATVDVTQEDDTYDLSPGMDTKARMAWSSTKEVTDGGRVRGVEGGGSFTAAVSASTRPGFPCDPTDYALSAAGEVSDSTSLTFRFIPKSRTRPGRGLKGWFIHTPTAMWKGTLSVTKPASGACGESYTEDSGSWIAAQAFAGGSEKGGGAPMAAPRVTVSANGDIRISGTAVYATAATRRTVTYTVVCTSAEACFGAKVPAPKPSKDLQIGWKFLGATCVPGPAGTNTFRMSVRVRMITDNGDASLVRRTWASGMTAGARIETTTPGFQFTRQWRERSRRGLIINHRYVEDFTIVTDNVSAGADWRLHLRYRWEIDGARDITRDVLSARPIATCGAV